MRTLVAANSSAYLAKEYTHWVRDHSCNEQKRRKNRRKRRICKQGIVLEDDGFKSSCKALKPEMH